MAEGLRNMAREIMRDVSGTDPEIQTLGGNVRVRIAGSTSQRDAVEALRRLADTLDDPGTWREVVGDA